MGHTRWATHGEPCKENAHPHVDCSGTRAVVHNGVLENFLEIRSYLEARGHKFLSETDSEVIAHLIEEGMRAGMGLKDALVCASRQLRGSMAVAAVSASEPDRLVCMRRESPLVIGFGPDGVYCASDIPALVRYASEVAYLPEGALAILTRSGANYEDAAGRRIAPPTSRVDWDPGTVDKGGFHHFMLKEIMEQPLAVSNTLRVSPLQLAKATSLLTSKVLLTGAGTSYHACLCAAYLLNSMGIDARAVISSEFQEQVRGVDFGETSVVGVSQSGETADTLAALRYAKGRGAKVVGITNTLGSSITSLSDVCLCTQGGPEIGVAATKSFLTQLVVLDLLSLNTARARGTIK
ncbi:MAG: isomerizing glutamine--fructose-6-phosphate transaminase, partial [Nitrososphaeria archaeon]|nr:isomerizing glutamine--fructose-6-phosphate transaminase [Nitrososphaeria archaeon]